MNIEFSQQSRAMRGEIHIIFRIFETPNKIDGIREVNVKNRFI